MQRTRPWGIAIPAWGFVVLASLALASLALAARPAAAKSYRAETYAAAIQILENGDLRIAEQVRFRFTDGPFTYVYRSLSRRGVDAVEVESSSEPFEVERGRRFGVTWNFPACRDTTRTFTLVYRVRGAIGSDAERRVLGWRAFPDERRYVIDSAQVRVTWPAGWPAPARAWAHPGRTSVERQADGLEFRVERLSRESTLDLHVEFPAGGIAAPLPAWQLRQMAWARRLPLLGALGAALLLLGLVVVLAAYRELAPGQGAGVRAVRTSAPPSDLSPPLAGALRGGSADMAQAAACFMDLASRGYLQFETMLSKRWWGGGQYVVKRLKPAAAPAAWERAVLDAAFRRQEGGAIDVRRAWEGIRRELGPFRAAVRAELEKQGDFDPAAGERKRRLGTIAALAGGVAAAALAAAIVWWRDAGPAALLPFAGLLLVTVGALIAMAALPRHTVQGRQRAEAWRGFGKHMRAIAKLPQPLDAKLFQEWMPYALALGVAGPWIHAGKKWKLDVPAWFHVPAGGDAMGGLAAVFAGASVAGGGAHAGSGSAGAGGGGSGAG